MAEEGVTPPALERRPELMPGLDFYLNAYLELRYDRPIGMDVGPIPWSSIDRWARRHEVDDTDDLDILIQHVRSLEHAMKEYDENKKDRKTKKRGVA